MQILRIAIQPAVIVMNWKAMPELAAKLTLRFSEAPFSQPSLFHLLDKLDYEGRSGGEYRHR
ncbi:MAG: hypothetical protein A3I66_05210 [Burkholderiales bacterium RIFCSPLOWO2_02_FULL_57_36]|nr:MAG: hypothetical protein A3I66_05210 [Burkholderiales bacterium RIFCSPLOWO2_02_FULL_57_36]